MWTTRLTNEGLWDGKFSTSRVLGGDNFCASNGSDVVMVAIVPFSFDIHGDSRKLQLAKCKQWVKIWGVNKATTCDWSGFSSDFLKK